MAKVTYASLKLKQKDENKTIKIEDKEIEIKQYLSISDKIDLVDITLQNSLDGRVFNPIKMNMFFNLYLVYLYTNISFTDAQKKEPEKLYDVLDSNGIIDEVISNIPDKEYVHLLDLLTEYKETIMYYNTTAVAAIEEILEKLPQSAQTAADIINGINVTDANNVIAFAKAVNGGKEI